MKAKVNKFKALPYAELTKDTRYEGTFEVLMPVPDRVKPHRLAQQFTTKKAAEDWIHSSEGQDAIHAALKGEK